MEYADSPAACIELATAAGCEIANLPSSGSGTCWCQFLKGTMPDYQPGAGYKACVLPPPPPLPPALPPLPPLPPAFPGFDVAAASEDQLRSLIAEAAASQADVSIYLPPRADFKLSSQISCSSTVKVTVASSGEGAKLDGQEQTGLFYLRGGCSLTLRGLTLVNGKADYGGVVEADGAGDVEIIDSDVRGCSADVRRVELAAPLQRRTAAGREIESATAASPHSPRNRRRAASSTRSTAVRSR